MGPTGVAPGVSDDSPEPLGATFAGVSSQRDLTAGWAAAVSIAGVLSHALVPTRPGVGVSSQRFLRDGVALGSPARPGVGVESHRLPSAPLPGVGVASHLLPSVPRPGVGVASHLVPSAPRPGVGVASLRTDQTGLTLCAADSGRAQGRAAAHHLLASPPAARPGVGAASHLLGVAVPVTRPGVGVASHLLESGKRPGVGVASLSGSGGDTAEASAPRGHNGKRTTCSHLPRGPG